MATWMLEDSTEARPDIGTATAATREEATRALLEVLQDYDDYFEFVPGDGVIYSFEPKTGYIGPNPTFWDEATDEDLNAKYWDTDQAAECYTVTKVCYSFTDGPHFHSFDDFEESRDAARDAWKADAYNSTNGDGRAFIASIRGKSGKTAYFVRSNTGEEYAKYLPSCEITKNGVMYEYLPGCDEPRTTFLEYPRTKPGAPDPAKETLKFIDSEHKRFFEEHAAVTDRGQDFAALVYTLGISPECRAHFADIFDARCGCIIPDGIAAAWQTGGSLKITRLAFNLFTHGVLEEERAEDYTPKALLSGLDESHRAGALMALTYFA